MRYAYSDMAPATTKDDRRVKVQKNARTTCATVVCVYLNLTLRHLMNDQREKQHSYTLHIHNSHNTPPPNLPTIIHPLHT